MASVAGLRGYVGVDLVLGDEPFVVDVNPRLTTSYVGLSKVTGFNVADTMVNVVLKKKLLLKKEGKGFAYFSKVGTSKPTATAFQRATQINEVLSPPFPMSNIKKAIALIRGQGDTMEEAQSQFEEAKSSLLNSVNGTDNLVKVLGFDIGGANTKAAYLQTQNGKLKNARLAVKYFPIWKNPQNLTDTLLALKKQLAALELDGLGVTMTAELSDVYQTKREGVRNILSIVQEAFPKFTTYVLNSDAELESVSYAKSNRLESPRQIGQQQGGW